MSVTQPFAIAGKGSGRAWVVVLVVAVCLTAAFVAVVFRPAYGPNKRVPLAPNIPLRSMKAGDRLTYKGWVTLAEPAGRQSSSLAATMTYAAADVGYASSFHPLKLHIRTACRLGPLIDSESLIAQDASHNMVLLGGWSEDGRFILAREPYTQLPGLLTSRSKWGYTGHYDNGLSEHATNENTAVEWVKTPLAEFQAYKVRYCREMSNGSIERGLVWMTPDYPEGVRIDYVLTEASGARIHVVLTLNEARLR